VPTVKWLGVHKNILMHDNKTNIESGLLIIRNLSIEDSGVYECIAENIHGKISHSITLQVQGKYLLFGNFINTYLNVSNIFVYILEMPYVKNGPSESVVINEGSSETLKCEARGTPPPKIIWYLNGKPVNDTNIMVKG